jgi:hypothetical protein
VNDEVVAFGRAVLQEVSRHDPTLRRPGARPSARFTPGSVRHSRDTRQGWNEMGLTASVRAWWPGQGVERGEHRGLGQRSRRGLPITTSDVRRSPAAARRAEPRDGSGSGDAHRGAAALAAVHAHHVPRTAPQGALTSAPEARSRPSWVMGAGAR